MPRRTSLAFVVALGLVAMASYGLGQRQGLEPAGAAQPAAPVWNSTMLWQPSLAEAGDALAGLTNQVDASCSLDVDPAVPTNGTGPEGAVYAFAVTWACPVNESQVGVATWNSAMLWRPTLAESGDALAELTNQIDVSCTVDVDRVVAANGAGPEGPVYAFAVTWACP